MRGVKYLVKGRSQRVMPRPGDLFGYRLVDGRHGFGRVVTDSAFPIDGTAESYLIYLFDFLSHDAQVPANLSPRSLLFPYIMTNRTPWTGGYFSTLRNDRVGEFPLLDRHDFWCDIHDCVRNEFGERVPRTRSADLPIYAMSNVVTIDIRVGVACGFESATG